MSVKPQPFMERFERLRLTQELKIAALKENNWSEVLGVAPDDLMVLADYFTPYQGVKGTVIFRKDDEESFMCLIQVGSVQIFASEREAAGEPISTLGKGHTVGEMALIDGEPRSAYAYLAQDTELFVMTRSSFHTLQQEHPVLWGKLLLQIARQMSARLRQTSDSLGRQLHLKWRRILQ
jgi:CRP/FNR family transcriptional regulator, cyclic AMP receptor protein